MKKIFICFSILSIGSIISACDETPGPASVLEDAPAITHIQVQPKNVEFTVEEDGFKDDTTITVEVFVSTINISNDQPPLYIMADKGSGTEIAAGTFDIINSENGDFRIEIPIETSTTSFEEFIINAFPSSNTGVGNFAQASFEISGISNNAPVILETDNPDEIQLPSSGNQNVTFTAKVTDEDGQNTIENVFMRLISKTNGEVGNSPFPLYDDGTNGGDEIANDSLFTLTFQINEQNQSDTYFLEYFAIDQGGLVSDTVTSTFSIIE
ncbi:hypothetical protein [Gracilimonas halophila]|uniref:Calx-beta domain-containing protein n=1 Tax=Gracilimonas halophila TaxID=1834464 RepID=A0ABW5JIA1_9BACT